MLDSIAPLGAGTPADCISPKVQDMTYYLRGNTWFQPSYGANGVSYKACRRRET